MKKISLLLLALGLSLAVNAQVIIESSMWPQVGDTGIRENNDPFPFGLEGSSGTNQTWDLTTLGGGTPDTAFYLAPGATSIGGMFPAANIARVLAESNNHVFYNWDAGSVQFEGNGSDPFGSGGFIGMNLVPPPAVLHFPFQYNDNIINNYVREFNVTGVEAGLTGIDSVRQKRIVNEDILVDGWGKVILPGGKSWDALRTHEVEARIDSTWQKPTGGSWFLDEARIDTLHIYKFYGSVVQNPMVQLKYSRIGNPRSSYYTVNPDTVCILANAGFTHALTGATGVIDFTNASSPADSIKYLFGDGNTSTDPNPTHTYAATNTYNVCIVAYNICGTDTFCEDVNVIVVGRDNGIEVDAIKVFPSPATQIVHFDNNTISAGTIQVVNIEGKVVANWKMAKGLNEYSVSDWSEGVYLYRILEDNGTPVQAGKLVVQ